MNRHNKLIMTASFSIRELLRSAMALFVLCSVSFVWAEPIAEEAERVAPMWKADIDVAALADEDLQSLAQLARRALIELRRERQLRQYHLEQNDEEVRRIYTEIVNLQRQLQTRHAELQAAMAGDEEYGRLNEEESALIERIKEVQTELLQRADAEQDD